MHSCLESELVVNEDLYLISLVRFNDGTGRLAIDGKYRSAMTVPSKPSICDCEIVGSLCVALHCRDKQWKQQNKGTCSSSHDCRARDVWRFRERKMVELCPSDQTLRALGPFKSS